MTDNTAPLDHRHYQTLVFDCDGVILDSNAVKTEGFYHAALPYGVEAAAALRTHHIATAGVSRYHKFRYFLEHLAPHRDGPDYDELLTRYATFVQQSLQHCALAEGLAQLREASAARWMIVSGGDETELRQLFAARGITDWFDGGIFGSPDTKDEILARELGVGNLQHPALFLGDAQYDHEAASRAGLDFVFVHGWSEFRQWPAYVAQHGLRSIAKVGELC